MSQGFSKDPSTHPEDLPAVSGDMGTAILSVRQDSIVSSTSTDGDYAAVKSDSTGRVYASVKVDTELPAGTQNIGDVDVVSVVSGTGATNLGKATDAVAGAADVGVASLLVRDDALTTITPADGDWAPGRINARGATWIAIEDGAGAQVTSFGGGTQYTEDAAAAADPVGNALILVRKDTLAGLTTTDGDNVAARGTDKGEQYVKHVDSIAVTDNGGNLSIDDGGNSITVDYATTGSGTAAGALRVELPTNGTGVIATVGAVTSITNTVNVSDATAQSHLNIIKRIVLTEDVLSADGDFGVGSMAIRKATPANTSGTDGDYEFLQMSAGRLWASATIDAALPAGANAIGKLAANAGVTIGAVEIAAAQTLATVTTVGAVTSITNTVTTKETRSSTGTTSQVADNAASVTVLASNASRLGCSIQNDSSAVLYIKTGASASATDYTARLVQYAYWEAPFNYTGIISGIWATDPNDGAARVTEYT